MSPAGPCTAPRCVPHGRGVAQGSVQPEAPRAGRRAPSLRGGQRGSLPPDWSPSSGGCRRPRPQERLCPSGRPSHGLSLSLLSSPLPTPPVELLGKSDARPRAALPPCRPCRICLSPPAQGHWRSLFRRRRSEEGGRSAREGLGHSPRAGPCWVGLPGQEGSGGQGGGPGPAAPRPFPPAPHPPRRPAVFSPSSSRFPWFFHCIFVSLLLFLCIIPEPSGDPHETPPFPRPGPGPGAPGPRLPRGLACSPTPCSTLFSFHAPSLGPGGEAPQPTGSEGVPGGRSFCSPRGVHLTPLSTAAPGGPRAAQGSARPRTWVALQLWCLFLCACLSVLSACAGDQPFHKPWRPGCPPRSPEPPGSAQPHGQGSHFGARALGAAGQARVPSAASPPHPPRERRPAASAGQRPAGRERHVPAAGGDGEAGGAPGPD